jgi:hypothetical protein
MSKIIGITNISKFIGVSRFKFFNNLFGGGVLDAYTKLLLHGDGTNGSTTFTDSSPNPKTITPYGNVQISTAQSKFSGSSMYFDGNEDYLSVPDSDDFNFGGGDFTIDLWVNALAVGQSNNSLLLTKLDNATQATPFCITLMSGSYILRLYMAKSSQWDLVNGATIGTLQQGVWSHVAVCRKNSAVYCFIDGSLSSTSYVGPDSVLNCTYPILIGSGNYSGCHFNGYIDELRISKGIARWTTNFTPPTYSYGG